MADRGVLYIAYGSAAEREAGASIQTLKKHCPTLHVNIVGDNPVRGNPHFYMKQEDKGGRWAKVNLDRISPYDQTLYIDADTRVHGDLMAGFAILDDGWDIAITTSENQGADWLWHVGDKDRAATGQMMGFQSVQLQGGLFYFAKNERVSAFFTEWRKEWERFRGQDQGALLRAMYASPVRVWLLGRDYNGGALVEHRFGAARA